MLDAEGHPVEFSLLSSFENPIRKGIALKVESDLKQLGIRLNYDPVDFPTLLRRINGTMDYESASMGFGGGGLDPASQNNVLISAAAVASVVSFAATAFDGLGEADRFVDV